MAAYTDSTGSAACGRYGNRRGMSATVAGWGNDGFYRGAWENEVLEVEMRQNDGGPAFPTPESHGDDYEGMSLRDYFAAKAMQGWWASPNEALPDGVTFEENQRRMCKKFYEWADVMLSAREK